MSTCIKCGATVAGDCTFCSACGTAVAAAPAVAPPVAYASSAVPPPIPVAKSGSALKIILIIVGVFVLLGVIAASVVGYGAYRISKAVHVDTNGSGMTIDSSNGKISAGTDSTIGAAELGVDPYPGAARAPGSLNLKSPDGSMTTANFTTSDSVSQVVDFYRSKLGENASTMETSDGVILTSDGSDPNDSLVVSVTAEGGKTKIGIVHSPPPGGYLGRKSIVCIDIEMRAPSKFVQTNDLRLNSSK